MSQKPKPLRTKDLDASVLSVARLNDRVRQRIRDEMQAKHLSQRDVAAIIGGGWSQSRIAQKLRGYSQITLSDLDALCFAVGISAVETVRDHGRG